MYIVFTYVGAVALNVGSLNRGNLQSKSKRAVLRRANDQLLNKLQFTSTLPCELGSKEAAQSGPGFKIMSSAGKINEGNGRGGLLQDDRLCNRPHKNNLKEETDIDQAFLSDRWEFLKSLPHKLVRDIGFVIASPDLLLDSNELPTVCGNMLGGSTRKWEESVKWLKALDMQHVMDWFGARKHRTRLGDHFAACIEYVLRFSPVLQVEQLKISQQVTQQMKMHNAPTISQNAAIRSENDFLKPASKQSEGLHTSSYFTNPSEVDTSQMNVGFMDAPSQEETAKNDDVPMGGSYRNQKQKNKLFTKMNKTKSCKTQTIGEFDFLFQCSDLNHDAPKACPTGSGGKYIECSSDIDDCMEALQGAFESEFSHKGDSVKEVHHWEASVKFLLYAGPWETFGMETPDYAAWNAKRIDESSEESSLCDGVKIKDRVLESFLGSTAELLPVDSNLAVPNSCESPECACGTNEVLGCFLGPHVGETLFDRKTRLCNQLTLSQNSQAALYLYRTYVISNCSKTDISLLKGMIDSSHEVLDNGCFSEGHDQGGANKPVETENGLVLKIVPGALLKGYLFYEYELWQLLRERRETRVSNICDLCRKLIVNCTKEAQTVYTNIPNEMLPDWQTIGLWKTKYQFQWSNLKSKLTMSKINPQHWMGWWTRINEFSKFAECTCSKTSRWYIVPKQEWLSPVIVDSSDTSGCAKVLTLEEFLAMAAKVAEEAALLQIPRKGRFMVAEVRWEADFTCPTVLQGQLEDHNLPFHSHGAWIEVSRGFVVEETWPDSKLYRPHGYVLNRLPSLWG